MADKVCVVTGVGPGTGKSVVERFAKGGYQVAMIARDADRLGEIAGSTPAAHAYPCSVLDTDALKDAVARIRSGLGPVSVLVHNAVAGTLGDFLSIEPRHLDRNFQVNTMALLHLAQWTAPDMIEAGEGAIIATGNTSAYRGKAHFAGLSPTKAAQRMLIESMARHLGPKGVHAAYIAIDAVIDVPWARERYAGKPDDFFCQPDDIASEIYHLAHQPKSAWTMDVVIRPFGEEF